MAENKTIRVQDTVFDLDTFSEVTLVKEVPCTVVSSVDEALAALGNDAAKLLTVINDGLRAETRRLAKADPTGYHTFTDEGEINGEFTGTPANITAVNALVLTLAKTVFGYSKDMTADQKRAAKKSAADMVSGTPAIREGLKKSAALGTTDAE